MAKGYVTEKRIKQWAEIKRDYQRRHRMWTMENLPSMSAEDWRKYEIWVANFGLDGGNLTRTGRTTRKVKRRLRAARSASPRVVIRSQPVTVAVTELQKMSNAQMQYLQYLVGATRQGLRRAQRKPPAKS